MIVIIGPNNTTYWGEWTLGGSLTFSIDITTVERYTIQPRCNLSSSGNFHLLCYFNETQIMDYSFSMSGYSYRNYYYTPPLISGFTFSLGFNRLCYEDLNLMRIQYEEITVSPIIGNRETDFFTISIEEGNQYISFYNVNSQQIVGDEISILLSEISDYRIKVDEKNEGENEIQANISIEFNNTTNECGLIINSSLGEYFFDSYLYSSYPIYPQESIGFEMYIDFDGECYPDEVPDGTTFSAEIISGNEYGHLVNPETDERAFAFIGLVPQFTWVNLEFIADGVRPVSNDTIVIRTSSNYTADSIIDLKIPIQPNPLTVYADPNPVIVGDTSKIVLKHYTESGGLIDFPPDQLFYIELYEGYDYGTLYSTAEADTNDWFVNVPAEFSFIAADSIDADSVSVIVWVGTRIENDDGGVISGNIKSAGEEQSSTVYNESVDKTINKNEIIRTTKEKESIRRERKSQSINFRKDKIKNYAKGKESGLSNIMSGYTYAEAELEIVVIKKPDCDDPIIVCDDFEPKSIDSSNFVILGQNEEWQWEDKQGVLQTANTGFPCDYITHPDSLAFGGVTFAPFKLGNHSSLSTQIYNTFEDIDISICLDNRVLGNEKWQFNLNNIKIPIIKVVCDSKLISSGKNDLIDGSDGEILKKYITDCLDLGDIISYIDRDLKFGPYWKEQNDIPSYLNIHEIFFSTGILAHETKHEFQIKENVIRIFNNENGLQQIKGREYLLDKSEYPCPEDALDAKRSEINSLLIGLLKIGQDLNKYYGKSDKSISNAELEADRYAMVKYEEIRRNIMSWAKNQIWWDENYVFCAELL